MRRALDELARGAHPVAREVGQLHACTVDRDSPDVLDREVFASETDRARHDASLRSKRMTLRKSSYRSLASLERDLARCRACAEAGFPLFSLPVRAPLASPPQRAYLFGQAPGPLEGQQRLPWRGDAGQRLRRWLELDEEEFYAAFYCASVTRCDPGRAVGPRRPDTDAGASRSYARSGASGSSSCCSRVSSSPSAGSR